MEQKEKYISVREASEITGRSIVQLRYWANNGKIRAVMPGKRKFLVLVKDNDVVFKETAEVSHG